MVWKKDLAKLKDELKKEGPSPSRPPQPKPAPKPAGPLDLGGEDAMFLAAMGLRRPAAPAPVEMLREAPMEPAPVPEPPVAEDFLEVMTALKGLKRTRPALPIATAPATRPAEPPPAPEPAPEVEIREVQSPPAPPAIEAQKREPVQIQLAAGMAIEVDGVLDLRGHSRFDALERLKERVLDGQLLGWRTCHVIFGVSDELATAFKEFLKTSEAAPITRYAQAPIPMGGAQAWILYYAGAGMTPKETL